MTPDGFELLQSGGIILTAIAVIITNLTIAGR